MLYEKNGLNCQCQQKQLMFETDFIVFSQPLAVLL